jgi:hypothetical protein
MPRLPRLFSLHIDGDLTRINTCAILEPDQLPYLVTRLMRGEGVGDGALEAFGLRILIEEDMDQGDEPPPAAAPPTTNQS